MVKVKKVNLTTLQPPLDIMKNWSKSGSDKKTAATESSEPKSGSDKQAAVTGSSEKQAATKPLIQDI